MFTFKLYKGDAVITPPNKVIEMSDAVTIAGHFSKSYHKVEIVLNEKAIVKTFENDSPIFSATLN